MERLGLTDLPQSITALTHLTELVVIDNLLESVPPHILQLTELTKLDLFYNSIQSVPAGIDQLIHLTHLNLGCNLIPEVPASIGSLTALTHLDLSCNRLTVLPAEFAQLPNLTYLDLSFNHLTKIPAALTEHPNLEYLGGMDIMATNNLTIRDCVAEGIQGGTSTGECNAAIFLWQGHNDFTIERNVIIDCGKGIGIGLCYYAGPTISGGWHADGGVIRNNTVMRNDGNGGNNIGLELCGLKNVDVQNNTIYSPDGSYFRNVSFWDNGTIPISNLEVENNIFRGGVYDIAAGDWSASAVQAMGNIVDTSGSTVLPTWFVDAANGDFHLTEAASAAIDQAATLADVTDDFDGGPRPEGGAYDYGADEFASPMGDATYDGVVDGADYTAWADHYDQSGDWGDGDFSGDGFVDGADYTAWADNYGYGLGAASSVPEPASAALMALGLLALIRRRKA